MTQDDLREIAPALKIVEHGRLHRLYASRNATCNVQLFCAVCIALIPCDSGIAAANRSHVKQFPDVAAYIDYYNLVVDTSKISVDQFAMLVQRLLPVVEYQRLLAMIQPSGVRDF
jgi:hypothetical protein